MLPLPLKSQDKPQVLPVKTQARHQWLQVLIMTGMDEIIHQVECEQKATLKDYRAAETLVLVGLIAAPSAPFDQIKPCGHVAHIKPGVEQQNFLEFVLFLNSLVQVKRSGISIHGTVISKTGNDQVNGIPARIHSVKMAGGAFRFSTQDQAGSNVSGGPATEDQHSGFLPLQAVAVDRFQKVVGLRQGKNTCATKGPGQKKSLHWFFRA